MNKNDAQIESDGRTVWINASDGSCIGRFSARGIDVHRPISEQLEGGSQCLDCCHDLPFEESWERFKNSMKKHFDITVPESHKPTKTLKF